MDRFSFWSWELRKIKDRLEKCLQNAEILPLSRTDAIPESPRKVCQFRTWWEGIEELRKVQLVVYKAIAKGVDIRFYSSCG